MTPRERITEALAFRTVDMIPVTGPYGWQFLEDPKVPKDKVEELREEMGINPPAVTIFLHETDTYKNGKDEWGVEWRDFIDVDHPLKEWDDLVKYEFPKQVEMDLFPVEEIAECRRKGETLVFGSAWYMITFERYRSLRGFENTLTDHLLYPDRCAELIDRIENYNLRAIDMWIELGCEIIGFADDWGSQTGVLLDPELWRKFYKPVYRRMCERIHEGGAKTWMHTDGCIEPIVPDLVEVGLDILDPVQAECVDVKQLSDEYKNQLVIWGGLDSHLIGNGTYETIRNHVRDTVELLGGLEGGVVGTTSNYLFRSPDAAIGLYRGFRNAS